MGVAAGGGVRLRASSAKKQRQRTLNNIKITLLCGFITVLVLRGTAGFNLLVSSGDLDGAAADAKVVEDVERILAEIRSDSEADDVVVVVEGGSSSSPRNATAASFGNFSASATLTTFRYNFNSFNYFGMTTSLAQLGNPNLEWQTTIDRNVGFDITILNDRLKLVGDYYYKTTDPLLITIDMPASSGATGNQIYKNFGKQN